jgi:photosystem II stability/assembly factor-like uncharacterized protein
MTSVSEWPDEAALRRALLEETDPEPGLVDRVLAGYRRAPARRRTPWALAAAAAILAALVVATLLLARAQALRPATPAASPSPTLSAPASAHGLGAVALTGPDSAWVVQPAGTGPGPGPGVLMTTTDHGAHWARRADLPGSLAEFHTEPGGRAMLFVTDLNRPGEAGALVIYGTSDAGASWQRMPAPPGGMLATSWARDGHEAWVTKWGQPDQTGRIRQWQVYHTADGARTWSLQATFDAAAAFGGRVFQGQLMFVDAQHGVFVPATQGGTGIPPAPLQLYTTADGGAHWQPVALPAPPGPPLTTDSAGLGRVQPLPDGRLALTVAGHVQFGAGLPLPTEPPGGYPAFTYVGTDGGTRWSDPRPAPGGRGRLQVTGDGRWWWVDPSTATIWSSADDGARWTPGVLTPPAGTVPVAVHLTGPGAGWLVTGLAPRSDSLLLITGDGGRTWRAMPPPDPIVPRVPCDAGRTAVVARLHLEVTSGGRPQPGPPATLGQAGACRYRLHALDGSGGIAIEATGAERSRVYTLGDLMDVWGLPDPRSASGFRTGDDPPVTVLVNGKPAAGDPRAVPLHDGDQLVIQVGSGGPAAAPSGAPG